MQPHSVLPMALLLGSTACASPPQAPPPLEYSVAIDQSFAMSQIESVTEAIDDWTTAVPELHLTYVIASCDAPSPQQVCLHPDYDPPDPTDDVVGTTYRGGSDSGTVLIFVNRIQATGWNMASLTRQTAAHELGHAMGLQHAAVGTLMAADVTSQAPSVTAADVAQFWAVRGQ